MVLLIVLYIFAVAAAPYKKHNDEDHDHDRDDGGSHRHDYDGVRTGRPNLGRDGHGQRWQQDTDHHRGESDEKQDRRDRHNIVHGHNDGDRKFTVGNRLSSSLCNNQIPIYYR